MTTPEERDAIEYEEYTDPNAEILALTASRDAAIDSADAAHEVIAELRAALTALEDAASEAHALLFHYHIARKPYGVDWGSEHTLRHKAIDDLWAAIEPARKLLS